MPTAREVMTQGAECVGENESMLEAAKKMEKLRARIPAQQPRGSSLKASP
jgi:hypothetical protein